MPNGGHYSRKNAERKKPSHPAFARRLERGANKLHKKQLRAANRISLNHQVESGGTRASEAVNTSDAPNPTNNTQPKENQA